MKNQTIFVRKMGKEFSKENNRNRVDELIARSLIFHGIFYSFLQTFETIFAFVTLID